MSQLVDANGTFWSPLKDSLIESAGPKKKSESTRISKSLEIFPAQVHSTVKKLIAIN